MITGISSTSLHGQQRPLMKEPLGVSAPIRPRAEKSSPKAKQAYGFSGKWKPTAVEILLDFTRELAIGAVLVSGLIVRNGNRSHARRKPGGMWKLSS